MFPIPSLIILTKALKSDGDDVLGICNRNSILAFLQLAECVLAFTAFHAQFFHA